MTSNPILPGFNPDPSVVAVDGTYYLVTSSFEYLPGLPVYRSRDLRSWTQIGSVGTRHAQLDVRDCPTATGTYAPTVRHRDGVFYVVVTVMASPRGCVLFTATDPAGPWSDGTPLEVQGIDPDLAWDEDGTAFISSSGPGPDGEHAILQVTVDLTTGKALEPTRVVWSGTGSATPEAPHLYLRDGSWYLLIAEGGTERGHCVSVARGSSPSGPFESCPANPVLSARSTVRSVQATGHGDLVETPAGTAMVFLGTRPVGAMYKFSPLGRETFVTAVDWVDGWPVPRPVEATPGPGTDERFDLSDPACLDDPGWIAVRALPRELATVDPRGLVLAADGDGPAAFHPTFVGRRQRHLRSAVTARLDSTAGTGGLATRYDERHWYGIEATTEGRTTTVTAQAHVPGLSRSWSAVVDGPVVDLCIETTPPPIGVYPDSLNGDTIRLLAGDQLLAELDGKLWSAEVCSSFTGRVSGVYGVDGAPAFRSWTYLGCDEQHVGEAPHCPLHAGPSA